MDEVTALLVVGGVIMAIGLVVSIAMAVAAKKSRDFRHRRVSRQRRNQDTSIMLLGEDQEPGESTSQHRHRRHSGLRIDLLERDEDEGRS